MKTFENTELGVKFDLPEDITLRQELNYFSTVDPSVPWMLAAWQAAMTLVKNWEGETIPDPHKPDLDRVYAVVRAWAKGKNLEKEDADLVLRLTQAGMM